MIIRRSLYKKVSGVVIIATALLGVVFTGKTQPQEGFHIINVKTPADTRNFFMYSEDRIPFVSANRGGPLPSRKLYSNI
jgi:hypothetical protein